MINNSVKLGILVKNNVKSKVFNQLICNLYNKSNVLD